ncbi:MAG: hypothetical protein ABSH28_08665 [Acidobacteriota bacterium]
MKKNLVVMIGLCLLLSVAAFAQTKPAKKVVAPAPKVMTATGVIKSADAASLVITHKVSGTDTDMTFVLNADTKKTGDMTPGAKATVHYKVDGSTNTATAVTATPAPAPKPVTKKK